MNEEDLFQHIGARILYDTRLLVRSLDAFEASYATEIRDWCRAETYLIEYRGEGGEAASIDRDKESYQDYISFDYLGEQLEPDSPFAPIGEGLILLTHQVTRLQEQRSGVALSTVVSIHNVDVRADEMMERLDLDTSQIADYEERSTAENAVQKLKQAWSGLVGKIKRGLGKIKSRLATLLANYLNLKEWTISGDVSTSPIAQLFGLSASAGIEVTFGP